MHAGDDDDGDYDYDDDDDDGSGSAVAIPHAERAVRAVMSMPIAAGLDSGQFAQAGAREIVQMEPLRKKRREEGYYADDGYAVARGVRQKPGAAAGVVEEDPDSPFSSKFIDDYIDREKLLRSDPVYRFLQSVVARSAITTLIDETAMTAATAERIRQAKAEFQRQRRVLVDSPAEQERLKRARDQLDAASAELTSLQGELTLFEAAKARIVAAFERINNAPPSIEPIAFSFTLTYNDLFDYFTKAACARYGAGGYRRSLIETRSIAEIVHGDALRRGTVGPNQNTLQKAMPSTRTPLCSGRRCSLSRKTPRYSSGCASAAASCFASRPPSTIKWEAQRSGVSNSGVFRRQSWRARRRERIRVRSRCAGEPRL